MSSTDDRIGGMGTPGIMTVEMKDKHALYAAYMPYIKNGGLFIATKKAHRLGEEVFALLHLQEQNEKLPVAGKVIWITPSNAQGKKYSGIGIQFSPQDNGSTQKKIEAIVAGMKDTDNISYTM